MLPGWPMCPIIGRTTNVKACRQLSLSWGITPVLFEKKQTSDELFEHAIEKTLETGIVKRGDIVALTAGFPWGCPATDGWQQALRQFSIRNLTSGFHPDILPPAVHPLHSAFQRQSGTGWPYRLVSGQVTGHSGTARFHPQYCILLS